MEYYGWPGLFEYSNLYPANDYLTRTTRLLPTTVLSPTEAAGPMASVNVTSTGTSPPVEERYATTDNDETTPASPPPSPVRRRRRSSTRSRGPQPASPTRSAPPSGLVSPPRSPEVDSTPPPSPSPPASPERVGAAGSGHHHHREIPSLGIGGRCSTSSAVLFSPAEFAAGSCEETDQRQRQEGSSSPAIPDESRTAASDDVSEDSAEAASARRDIALGRPRDVQYVLEGEVSGSCDTKSRTGLRH